MFVFGRLLPVLGKKSDQNTFQVQWERAFGLGGYEGAECRSGSLMFGGVPPMANIFPKWPYIPGCAG